MKIKYIKAGAEHEDRYELWVITRDHKNQTLTESPTARVKPRNISEESWDFRLMADEHSSCHLIGEIRGYTDWNNDREWAAFVYEGTSEWDEYDPSAYKRLCKRSTGPLTGEKEFLEDYFMEFGVEYL
tara:strand:- start:13554 stop:13937 length:384 start_codon:yes stop_codon:yes gene_type:complete